MTERHQQEPDVPPRISPGGAADEPGEMELTSKVDEDLCDAVVRGEIRQVPAELLSVAEALVALRARVDREPLPPMSGALRAQISAPNVVALRAARSMRRAVAAAAAAAAAVVVVGVGAAQNRLPSQLQDVVSSTAELVGIDVPHSDERGSSGSDVGLEHGHDDIAPNRPLAGVPGIDGPTPGGATPATPGGPDGPATPATPPDQAATSEKVEKVEKVEAPAAEPVDPVAPAGPPGQDQGTPPSAPQGGPAEGSTSTTPPSRPNGAGDRAGGVDGATAAADAPGQGK